MTVTAGSICSGIGGLDMAVEAVFGATTIWQAEVDPHAVKVLRTRWPAARQLGDITAVDWSTVEPVDVLAGGTPCQDLSIVGGRAGMRAGTRSGLWDAMATAIEVLRPSLVIWENVNGALSACAHSDMEPCPGCMGDTGHEPVLRAAGRVLGDLASLGFDAEWGCVRASDIGACHSRDRVWVVAWPADTEVIGPVRPWGAGEADEPQVSIHVADLLPTPTSSPNWNTPERHLASKPGRERVTSLQVMVEHDLIATGGRLPPTPTEADTDTLTDAVTIQEWGPYEAAIARHTLLLNREPPSPTNDRGQLSARFVEWMMCHPDGWVTDLCTRTQSLRVLGNSVVPPQAAAAITWLLGRAAS